MLTFSHESYFFQILQKSSQSGPTAEASPGNPLKTSEFYRLKAYQCKLCHMVRMTYILIHLCPGLYCRPFHYWVAAHLHLATTSYQLAPLKSMKTHPLTLRLFLLISLYTTLLFITKSLQLLPVRGGLTLDFLKEGKKLCDARGFSVGQ